MSDTQRPHLFSSSELDRLY